MTSVRETEENEALASQYVEAWERVLEWRQLVVAEPEPHESGVTINILSLLTPPPELAKEMAMSPEKELRMPFLQVIADRTQSFLNDEGMVDYSPRVIHMVLYPRREEGNLLLGDEKIGGSHIREGGYPAMLVPLRDDGADYSVSPFVIGHELGEVIYTEMIRQEDGRMGPHSLHVNPLREGLCNAIGIEYHNYLSPESSRMEYDKAYREEYSVGTLQRILDEVAYTELGERDRGFAEYVLGGSIVSLMVSRFGLAKVLEYFRRCAEKDVARDIAFQETMEQAQNKLSASGVGISMTFATEEVLKLPARDDLRRLLAILGYDLETFPEIKASTKPLDMRPEGVLGVLISRRFSRWFENSDEEGGEVEYSGTPTGESRAMDQAEKKKETFLSIVEKSMDRDIAAKVFGEEFTIGGFLSGWREKVLSMSRTA